MRVPALSILFAFLAVVDARPILSSHFVRDDTALDAGAETQVSVATDASSVAVSATEPSFASATADVSASAPTDSTAISVTDSAVFPTATDDSSATNTSFPVFATSPASPTDTSDATDSPTPTPSDVDAAPTPTPSDVADLPSATDSTDPSDAAPSASVGSGVLPTAVPVSPPACVAKAASLPPPTDTSTADPSTVTSSADNSTDTSTIDPTVSSNATASASFPTDSGSVNATASASLPTDSGLASPTASATDSALPATATNANVTNPFASVNNTQSVSKRIAQADLPDVAQAWQDLCLVSGGDIFTNEPCVNLAGVNGINALLANADPCAQQDNADAMIDFAKSPGVTNADALIQNAIAFRKHPRNALNVLGVVPSTPFCLTTPRNAELVGVVNDQLPGVDPGIFGGPTFGLIAFGDDGTCPPGSTPDVDSCSCVQSSAASTNSTTN